MLAIIPLQRAALSNAHWLTMLAERAGLAQVQKKILGFAARRPVSAALLGLGAFMIVRMMGGRR